MVPLPIDNELDHMTCARAFIEKYVLARLASRSPNSTSFLTLDLALGPKNGHCLPDFAVFTITRAPKKAPVQRIYGFELKVPASINVKAVEQAGKQKASVDAANLLFLLPEGYPAEKRLPQIRMLARQHGVGIIRVRQWERGRDYEGLESPKLAQPIDQDAVDTIRGRLSSSENHFLKRWMQ